MSQVRQEEPSMLARAEAIQRQIHELSSRDMELWSVVVLIVLVMTGGFFALAAPNLVWAHRVVLIQPAYLPQLLFGLVCLVVLFNLYLLSKRVALNATRKALISELVLNERLESRIAIEEVLSRWRRLEVDEAGLRRVRMANVAGYSNVPVRAVR